MYGLIEQPERILDWSQTMALTTSDNTRLEQMIAEAFAAQRAGVFAQTPVDVTALSKVDGLASPQSTRRIRFHERLLVGMPVAACVAVIIGVASLWSLDAGKEMASPLASLSPASDTSNIASARVIVDCLSGPGAEVSDRCSAADFDDDGDVDLLDLSAYQREVAGY